MIHEKNLKQKLSWHCPFKGNLETLLFSLSFLIKNAQKESTLSTMPGNFSGTVLQNNQKVYYSGLKNKLQIFIFGLLKKISCV